MRYSILFFLKNPPDFLLACCKARRMTAVELLAFSRAILPVRAVAYGCGTACAKRKMKRKLKRKLKRKAHKFGFFREGMGGLSSALRALATKEVFSSHSKSK
jgi:hypothetical protein